MNRTVKANKHRFTPSPFGLTATDIISKMVCFDFNCKYDIGNDQSDINKLFGLGFFPHHHSISGRIGWRWNIVTQKVELFGYVYNRGKRETKYLTSVRLGEKFRATITLEGIGYGFIIQRNGIPPVHEFVEGQTFFIGYKLGAYFGGNRKAPHKMNVWISD